MSRTVKTPEQRATEALEVADRKVARLTEKRDQLRAELEAVMTEVSQAERRRTYLAANPDLPGSWEAGAAGVDDE